MEKEHPFFFGNEWLKFQSLVENLYDRWKDEREYEDWSEYEKVIKENIPVALTFEKVTKRPFHIFFKLFNKVPYRLHVTSSQIRLARSKYWKLVNNNLTFAK